MNIEQAKHSARAFHLAAQRCFGQRQAGHEAHQILMVPAIACEAFAAELALKALLLRAGKRAHGHDLRRLFQRLDSETQVRIQGTTEQTEHSFDHALAEAASAFETWRYIYEQPAAQASPRFLTVFADAILQELD